MAISPRVISRYFLTSSLPQFTDFHKLLDSYYLWFDKKDMTAILKRYVLFQSVAKAVSKLKA